MYAIFIKMTHEEDDGALKIIADVSKSYVVLCYEKNVTLLSQFTCSPTRSCMHARTQTHAHTHTDTQYVCMSIFIVCVYRNVYLSVVCERLQILHQILDIYLSIVCVHLCVNGLMLLSKWPVVYLSLEYFAPLVGSNAFYRTSAHLLLN